MEPWIQTLVALALLVGAAAISYWVAKVVLLKVLRMAMARTSHQEEGEAFLRVVRRLANLVPATIIQMGIGAVPHLPPVLVTLTRNVTTGFVILTVALAISAALDWLAMIYGRRSYAANRPIKGYLQIVKIALYSAAAILIIAALIDRSPVLLLSGLGAMAAVLLLVFQHTILSFVASVQLTSNDMIRIGDWIEMPDMGADGFVIDIALHTVKVQNWDKTIVTLPTHRLISESFRNWRGMFESGGRRIMRSLSIDQNSVRFLEPDEIDRLRRFSLLNDYLDGKDAELAEWNAQPQCASDKVNARRLTNIGTFRAYVQAYLMANDKISKDMLLLVRQLAPTETGLPIEIYAFTTDTAWVVYEGIQGDVFDHLIAILPEFGLRVFQQPTGLDLVNVVRPPGSPPAMQELAPFQRQRPEQIEGPATAEG